ncbi:MAG: hypothetical protein KDH96_02060 [Candidatus Riesia sp.]|nr:hypothetical protein [Candidatus Riesia sp.]
MENNVDSSTEIVYNDTQDDENVIVKMDEQRPINDLDCQHLEMVPDPNDTIGEAIYYGCSNPKCGRGYYLK